MTVQKKLAELARACEYSDGEDGEETGVDSLIDYKNALEELVADLYPDRAKMRKIHRYLYPELYPAKQVADHPNYSTGDDYYEWNADTIVIVADMVDCALADDPTTPKHA